MTEDEETIHLMTRMAEQTGGSTTGSTTQNTQNTQNTAFNANPSSSSTNPNPFGNILGNLLNNPNSMMQMTSMFMGSDGNINMNSINNLIGGITGGQGQGGADLNSLLQNIMNPSANTTQTTQSNTTQTNTTTQNTQYPILNTPNLHINNLNGITQSISGASNTIPTIPELNYPLNILTAV